MPRRSIVPNLLRTGAEWLQRQRHAHCTDQVVVGGVSLLATCAEADKEVEIGGVKLTGKIYLFILRASDIAQYNISVVRGLEILWSGNTYEVMGKGGLDEDNDPTGFDILVYAVKR